MQTLTNESLPIRGETDIVQVRQVIRKYAVSQRFTLTEQTKLVTAASEIARNTLIYGGGGKVDIESIEDAGRLGVRLVFADNGPGIPDIEKALSDGFTSGGGLGLGLGGSKRLVSDFDIQTAIGEGTRVTLISWK